PDDARPGRRDRRSVLEHVTVALTATAFIVGSIFSYLSVAVSRDAVTVAQRQLDDTQNLQDEEMLNDLSQISFSLGQEAENLVITIKNMSPRSFYPNQIMFSAPDGGWMRAAISPPYTATENSLLVRPCTTAVLTVESTSSAAFFRGSRYYDSLVFIYGYDSASLIPYIMTNVRVWKATRNELNKWKVSPLIRVADVRRSEIDNC